MKNQLYVFFVLIVLALSHVAIADDAKPMPLWPGEPPLGENATADDPDMTVYLPDSSINTGAAVVIYPGGGYWALAVDHEGRDVATWLNSMGVAGIVVRYRRGPGAEHPVPLLDAQRAIRTVRYRATEWGIDPARIGVIGFSAGGHLASTTGTHFDAGNATAEDPIERQSSRPDFMILVYPVITMVEDYGHMGSRRNLLGENSPSDLAEKMSSELQVTDTTPPTFLVLSTEDSAVPAENSVYFYLALKKAGVPSEMHIFEKGKHGFGLAPFDPVLSDWMELCEQWLRVHNLL